MYNNKIWYCPHGQMLMTKTDQGDVNVADIRGFGHLSSKDPENVAKLMDEFGEKLAELYNSYLENDNKYILLRNDVDNYPTTEIFTEPIRENLIRHFSDYYDNPVEITDELIENKEISIEDGNSTYYTLEKKD